MTQGIQEVRASTVALVVLTLATNLFFSGFMFGWASLKVLLDKDGVYKDLCESPGDHSAGNQELPFLIGPGVQNETSSTCRAKETAFAGIFTVAGVVSQVSGIVCGCISDTLDPRLTVALGGTLVSIGILLLGVLEPSPDELHLLPAVYGFLTFGGMMLLFSSFSASFLWNSRQGLILTAANTFFDASAVTPLILLQLYDAGIPRRTLFAGLALILVVLVIAQVLLWFYNIDIISVAKQQTPIPESTREQAGNSEATLPLIDDHGEADVVNSHDQHGAQAPDLLDAAVPAIPPAPRSSKRTVLGSLWTRQFVFLVAYPCVHVFREVVFLGTIGNLLSSYGDRYIDFRYTRIFSLLLPTGMLYTPLISWLFDTFTWRAVFQICSVIGLTWNVMALVPVLPLQVLTGLVFTCFRALLFSSLISFCTDNFGASTSGRIYGIATLVTGLFSSLQYPAVDLTYSLANGDLRYLYAIMALSVPPTMLLASTVLPK